ncbi:Trm112 family protein [Verrucomicrobiota bacterium sgz303538]
MVAPELLELLCCPETHQALHVATSEQLTQVNREGTLNRAGAPVRLPIPAGLVREDGTVLYPVWDDIPCLLIEEGIPLKSAATQA